MPVTATPEQGPWYAVLKAYKHTDRTPWPFLACLAGAFLETHHDTIADRLEGSPDMLCVVPSTRGVPRTTQPLLQLAKNISAGSTHLPPVRSLLEYTNIPIPRQKFTPQGFRVVDGKDIGNKRVLLLDDSWASGSKAVSAAGTLHEAGAASVAVIVLARLYNENFWDSVLGKDNAYFRAMQEPWTVDRWPLSSSP